METPENVGNNELVPVSTEPQPGKRRKKKSIVWEHFTIETVSAGCRRACCKQCKQSFAYSTGSKVAGTSHLKRHIAKGTCPALLRGQDTQLMPYTPGTNENGVSAYQPKQRYTSHYSSCVPFDPDRCRQEIARMIILHEYPLHMVEHAGFVTFVRNLQPRFGMVSFDTVQGDCMAVYMREKQSAMKFVEGMPGRVSLSLEVWTSCQSVVYVFISGHFIDNDWNPHRRILNVVMEPYPDSDTALSHAVACCLADWNLEGKLFSVAFNHRLEEPALENLRSLLCSKNPLVLDGQLLIGNCVSSALSGAAKEILCTGQEVVRKVRECVKYVKTSEYREQKFLELKQQLQVPGQKSLSLDDVTRWDTTHSMLLAASELKQVFYYLDTCDPEYKLAPSMEDWKRVDAMCTHLNLLSEAAGLLTATSNPTAVNIFHEVWKIQTELAHGLSDDDSFVRTLANAMHEKIEMFWKNCYLVLAVAVVMDPRFKMRFVEFSFSKIYGENAATHLQLVSDGLNELFLEYSALPLPLPLASYDEQDGPNDVKAMERQRALLSANELADFDAYIMQTSNQHMKSELDQYLEESLLPRVQEIDVLGWWKLNKLKFPTLSKMAHDVFAVPLSSVAPDSIFLTTAKELDPYRSSLRPETVEALVCAKDWIQHEIPGAQNEAGKLKL